MTRIESLLIDAAILAVATGAAACVHFVTGFNGLAPMAWRAVTEWVVQ